MRLVITIALVALVSFGSNVHAQREGLTCAAEQTSPLPVASPQTCDAPRPIVESPSQYPLREYEESLGEYLRGFCHRDPDLGWRSDKRVRDTGPYILGLNGAEWSGNAFGTHMPVVIWYSRSMFEWLQKARPADGAERSASTPASAPPDGAIMVKEMYPAPAAACADADFAKLLPTNGAAIMVRDSRGSFDGWFWGYFGWSDWRPDWPPGPTNPLPGLGFGQYCLNCHASATDNATFAALKNIAGEPGLPTVYLSQNFATAIEQPRASRHATEPTDAVSRIGQPHYEYDTTFTQAISATNLPRPTWDSVVKMPSQTFDTAVMPPGHPDATGQFLTSDQCVGCHDAGATGLQNYMTTPNNNPALGSGTLNNYSPYATWGSSPMGLAGRDPIFFAQLASETETFHPTNAAKVQDICLGCHGITGQRQHAIDKQQQTEVCVPFTRDMVNAVPWPVPNENARYGALARDGISCTSCHHMVLGNDESNKSGSAPQNTCVKQRQKKLNPGKRGFAATFTGSFLVGPADEIYGPFKAPKHKPMEHALGIKPAAREFVKSSELCGTCHTVHLPVVHNGRTLGFTYEQTTYPEWAFSAFRTGYGVDGKLPGGAGSRPRSCQSCHMKSQAADGSALRSKIASIQEYSSFPSTENVLGPSDIDLSVRDGFARHTLVGLNLFLVKMAEQFPDLMGIRTTDPMLLDAGVDPLLLTEQAMLDQATNDTIEVTIDGIEVSNGQLRATVNLLNKAGHKLPSGVGFRRMFVAFDVLDALGNVIWSSGATNGAGVIVDAAGTAVEGEFWWRDDCSARLGTEPQFQPHYQKITAQSQVQIYQELVTAPPAHADNPVCGMESTPGGQLTTSFLSICGHVKDNRLLPAGFLPLAERELIARALGAGEDLARGVGPYAIGDDPHYRFGGGDAYDYEVDLAELNGRPAAAVQATVYSQATPPFFLQDRFCTSRSDDTQRLYFMSAHLNLDGTAAEDWKFELVSTGPVPVK